MPEGNPLVAKPQDQTTAVTGIGIAESAQGLAHGISNGDWVEAGLSAAGVGLEVLSMVIDPIGTLASYGVSWLIEHVRPLKEALDWFAGDPPVIQSFSQTWGNVAKEVNALAADLANQTQAGTSGWTGTAADAYRGNATEAADAISGAGTLADGISAGVMIMGEVVAFVREFIRDMVGELVGRLISWALEEAATLGLATPLVVAQATSAISKVVNKISDLVRKLVKTIGNVTPRIRKVIDKLDEIMGKLAKLMRKADGDAPTSPSAARHADDATTTPSVARHGDDTTSPSTARHADDTGTTPSSTKTSTPEGGTTPSSTPDTSTSPKSPDTGSGSPGTTPNGKPDPIRGQTKEPRTTAQRADARTGCGDPVDVVSGHMFATQTDVLLNAALPLTVRRTHVSGYRVGRLFGRSWSSTLDQRIEVDADGVCFAAEDGVLLVYPTPAPGFPVLPVEGPRWPLAVDADGTMTITQDGGLTLRFAGAGDLRPLSAVIDRNGNRIDIHTDDAGMPVEVRHSGGYRVAVDHNGSRITALRLLAATPDGTDVPLMRYRYDAAGNLAEVINASGLPQVFTYDADGRVTGWRDRVGTEYRYHFDAQGRVVRAEGSGGILNATFEYRDDHTVVLDSLGHRSEYHVNELRQIVRTVDPLGATTHFEWDRYDRLLASTDPLGRTTRCHYDAEGRRTELVLADGTTVRAEYNDLGLPTHVVDAEGLANDYSYDERGNLVAITDRSGATTRSEYDDHGHLVAVTDPSGAQTRIVNNAAGLPMVVVDPMGNAHQYVRDVFGRPSAVIDPLGGQTRYGWTVEGRLAWQREADGTTHTWRYDAEGNLVERTDGSGARTVIEVGDFGLPRAIVTPDGTRASTFTYDTEQRITSVTNAAGATWTYVYDPAGNLVEERDFGGHATTFRYDDAGRLVSRTNSAGQTVTYAYDQLDRLERRVADDGETRYTYNRQGLLTGAVNPAGELTVSRDAAGTVLAEAFNGQVLRFGYDPNGRRVRRITPSGAVEDLGYDRGGRVAMLRTAGHTVAFDRDPLGRETARRLAGGLTLAQRWDPAGRLAEQSLLGANTPSPLRRRFHWRDGLLTGEDDSLRGNRRFEFDPVGRLAAVHAPGHTERYAYDPTGNLTHASGLPDSDTQGARTFHRGLVRGAGRTTYTHDAHGRVTEMRRRTLSGQTRVWRYTWNADDQLVSVTTPDGHVWRYRYDPLGRRCAKVRYAADGVTELFRVEFTWDGIQLAEQRTAEAVTTWSVEPGTALPVAQVERAVADGGTRFHHVVTDHLGTPRELVDPGGRVAWQATTSAWGALLDARRPSAYCPLRFPGQYHDQETGLHYNMFRYYNPDTGQYLTPDPLGLGPAPNNYAYTTNPLRYIDPLGLTVCERFNNFRRQVSPGELHGAPPPYPGGRPGHAQSKHGVSPRVQADILNNPDRVFSGHYQGTNHHTGQPYTREVDVYYVAGPNGGHGSVVITEAGNKNSVITAYGLVDTRATTPRPVDPSQWANDPNYVEINTSGGVNEVVYPNRERWERNDWP